MKRRLFLTALCLILLFSPTIRAFAADAEAVPSEEPVVMDEAELDAVLKEQEDSEEAAPADNSQTAGGDEEEASAAEAAEVTGPDILVNGTSIREQASARVYGQTTYVSLRSMTLSMIPDAQVSWTGSGALVQADGLTITAKPGDSYLVANGRYLYIPDGVVLDGGVTLVPVRVLARALEAAVAWDASTGNILITRGSGLIAPGESYYKSDAVYWLSHIINAESGTQPLEGKIAVGTVILNRVSSPLFPNTIYNVIFECRSGHYQFSPAGSGSVNREPNAESILAAKLCLDGAREAGSSLFFNGVGQTCWASRNRTLVTTIGGHNFYD